MSRILHAAWRLGVCTLLGTEGLSAQTIAITGGTVITVSGSRIPNGTVLIRDSLIVAVGPNVEIPHDAVRIDATGKTVTPGLIAASSQVGVVEIGLGTGTVETGVGYPVAAAFNVAEGINPASTLIPVTRIDGVTSVAVEPQGQFLAGQGVFMDLSGATLEAMLVRNPSAMYVSLDEASKGAGDGARAATLERLRRIFLDARAWAQRRSDFERRPMRDLAAPAADLEALQPVLAGRLPLVITANRVFDIRNALRLAREFNLKIILHGAAEGWQMADEIARAGVGVILEPETDVPTFDQLGARYSNPAQLARAGVRLAIVGGGDGDGTVFNTRLIRQEAGNAVATGLDWDAALRAVTLSPAEMFGVAERYGSLDAGKIANVVVWSGDPFEFSTGVEHVFIRGREIPLTSRQTELLERYRTLPPRW